MTEEQIELRIYLKSKRRPIVMIVNTQVQIDKFVSELNSNKVTKFGNFIFPASEIEYIFIKE